MVRRVIDFFYFFATEFSSKEFEQLYNLLGERVRLKNWDRYRAGLDTDCKCDHCSSSAFLLRWLEYGGVSIIALLLHAC